MDNKCMKVSKDNTDLPIAVVVSAANQRNKEQ